jgi:hypothetical protein
MRQDTADLDLESFSIVPSFEEFHEHHRLMVASLRGVRVYVLGADGTGRPITYWQRLQAFWANYFRACGATLNAYSVLRALGSNESEK